MIPVLRPRLGLVSRNQLEFGQHFAARLSVSELRPLDLTGGPQLVPPGCYVVHTEQRFCGYVHG